MIIKNNDGSSTPSLETKTYIGDSVYAEVVDGMILLTTENGYGPSNSIYLERQTYDELVRYVERVKEVF